jgi:hypothetical protein
VWEAEAMEIAAIGEIGDIEEAMYYHQLPLTSKPLKGRKRAHQGYSNRRQEFESHVDEVIYDSIMLDTPVDCTIGIPMDSSDSSITVSGTDTSRVVVCTSQVSSFGTPIMVSSSRNTPITVDCSTTNTHNGGWQVKENAKLVLRKSHEA